ncbi:hypothetical protein IW261DRAFT_1594697 [Armillaria novae-zelandiae]|uniref:Uncharacterized protein n=1 Tax=Armillaria novae-zelandiae TaxID=153914 RepID=A0AA39P3U0_9AGAR|nr:hypothetical protein IW261DRAFT_1594697 [Armillaria novae-zelandiae]
MYTKISAELVPLPSQMPAVHLLIRMANDSTVPRWYPYEFESIRRELIATSTNSSPAANITRMDVWPGGITEAESAEANHDGRGKERMTHQILPQEYSLQLRICSNMIQPTFSTALVDNKVRFVDMALKRWFSPNVLIYDRSIHDGLQLKQARRSHWRQAELLFERIYTRPGTSNRYRRTIKNIREPVTGEYRS